MATTAEFFSDYEVKIRADGQKRWPKEVNERIVADILQPDVSVNATAARYGLRAMDKGLSCAHISAFVGWSAKPAGSSHTSIEIPIGRVIVRLDGPTSLSQATEVVRAIEAEVEMQKEHLAAIAGD